MHAVRALRQKVGSESSAAFDTQLSYTTTTRRDATEINGLVPSPPSQAPGNLIKVTPPIPSRK